MAKGSGGGSATKPSGPATPQRNPSTRGFTPPGAKSASGPAIRSAKSKWKPAGKSGYDVQK